MKQQWKRLLWWTLPLPLAGLLLMPVLAAAQAGQKPLQLGAIPSVTQYAGTDTCKTCHEDLYRKNFENTAHFKTTLQGEHGCESCHGPGAAHVEAGCDVSKIVTYKNLSKMNVNKRCLSCHGENFKQRHFSSSM